MLVSRVRLADLAALGTRRDWHRESATHSIGPCTGDEYVIVWHPTDLEIPEAVLVPTPLDEFFAWSSTYLPHLTPLSGFLRVASSLKRPRRTSRFPIDATLGLLFAEVAAGQSERAEDATPTIGDFLSTLSFCLAQAACYEDAPDILDVARRWTDARRLVGAAHTRFAVEHLLEVWALTSGLEALAATEANNLFEYAARRQRGSSLLTNFDLSEFAPEYADLFIDLDRGALEDRVRTFVELLRRTRSAQRDTHSLSLVAGAALSRVSKGSFRYARLLGPSEVPDVRPLLWYGWFEASATDPVDEATWFGGAAGLRLRLELARWSDDARPEEFDIALEELQVLRRERPPWRQLETRKRGIVRVQLFEGVVAEFVNELPATREHRPGQKRRR